MSEERTQCTIPAITILTSAKEKIYTVKASISIMSAIALMRKNHVTSVLVVDRKVAVLGIVTLSDLRSRAQQVGLQCDISSIMSKDPWTLTLEQLKEATLPEVATLMTEKRVHHLLIEDGGRVVGILTPSSIITILAQHSAATTLTLCRFSEL